MIKKIDNKAFTLIEVLVVVAVIGILSLLAIPRFIGQTQKADLVRIQHDVKAMEKEIGAKLINKDNEFNEWESNSKYLNQLVQDKELFERQGIAEEVDSTDGTYKVIPKEYKDKINTKLKGTFYANSGGKVYYEHRGILGDSDEEINDRINPDDAKWVEKGNWGTNGKWVMDKDGNAVIYAIDASKPIVFHDMWTENAKLPTETMWTENEKLPTGTMTTLTFQDKVQGDTNSSMSYAFNFTPPNFKTINNLDTNVDTSNVTDMSWMFNNSYITSVGDLSKWNTSNVTDMSAMFNGSQLTSVGDLSQWDTSKVTNMAQMFWASKLTSVGDLSQWNASNVTNMVGMFAYSQLTSVGDLGQWNTSNVTDMTGMFSDSQLTSVGDLSQWNTSNVTNMNTMFAGSKLTSVGDLGQWNTSNVTYMSNMFRESHLTSVGDLGQWNTSNVADISRMFYKSHLTSVGDLSQWNTSNVRDMVNMFTDSTLTPPAWYH